MSVECYMPKFPSIGFTDVREIACRGRRSPQRFGLERLVLPNPCDGSALRGAAYYKKFSKQLFSVMVGLVLAGCSNVVPTAAQQGVDNKVISIGLASILSGPNSVASQFSLGTRVYLDMLNRTGGVNGYTFKYVERDTANQPAQAAAVTQQFVNEDKVFAMLAVGSNPVQAIVPTAASLKTPILAFADGDLLRPVIANVFGFIPRYSALPLFDSQFLVKNLGIKQVAYLYEDDAVGRPALKTLPAFVSTNGAQLVASVGFAADTTDWAPFAQKLKESGAEGVAYAGASQLAGMQKAADAIGYHPKYVSFYGNLAPSYLKLAGPVSEGTYIDAMQQPPDPSTPAGQKFTDEMKRAGQEAGIGGPASQGWTAGAVFEEGVRRATANGASLTWDSFISALNSFKNQEVGMYPSLTYTPQDHTGVTQAAIYQVQNGQFVQVLGMTDVPQPSTS
jgi:branched-chain amino acid transport system substrate-binding protein